MSYTTNKRNAALSISRIVGMIFIVICHIINYYTFIPMSDSLPQFFNCGVPIFIFISGYLYGGKFIHNFKKWYLQRIIIIAMPAIILSIVMIIILSSIGEKISINSIIAYCLSLEGLLFIAGDISSMFFKYIPGLGHLWFITIIIICYLLIPVLQKVSSKSMHPTRFLIVFFLVASVISIVISNYCSLFYFVIFATGYFSKRINLLERVNTSFLLIYTAIFFAAILGRLLLQQTMDGTSVYSSYVAISHLFVGTWFVVLFSFLNNKFPTILTKIADLKVTKLFDSYSFYIYLTHGVLCIDTFNVYEFFSLPLATILFFGGTIISTFLLKYISDIINKVLYKKIPILK
ncbi:MAG: acyltransferase [Ruminococcus sp.]|nr:acyltransferase [Ruminococcus sp.]